MAEEGADFLDIGGESTRPFSDSISDQEEMDRVIPVIEELRKRVRTYISIDTTKADVAREAVKAGAALINDISALRFDPDMARTAAALKTPVALMHMKGTPKNMQVNPVYDDLMGELIAFFRERIDHAFAAGIPEDHIIIDPGIGFGKTFDHNLMILNRLRELTSLGRPVLLGTSRKSFLGKITGTETAGERDAGTGATTAIGIYHGARIIRAHNVLMTRHIADVTDAIKREHIE
jgi:dihydropteroate synthase